MIDTVLSRVKTRLKNEIYDADMLAEVVQGMIDRLCLRLQTTEAAFPAVLYSVAVDASVKAWRRQYYEGIKKETIGGLSTEFDSILDEYADELAAYLASQGTAPASKGVISFL